MATTMLVARGLGLGGLGLASGTALVRLSHIDAQHQRLLSSSNEIAER